MTKVWLITGCSTGFGREIAIECLKRGYKVAVTARDPSTIEDIVSKNKENAEAFKLDVLKQEDIDNTIKGVLSRFGRIDVLVNNAGACPYVGAYEELGIETIKSFFDLNIFSVINLTNAVLPTLRSQRSGHIVNVSSIGGFVGSFPALGSYCSAKFALFGYSESLQAEVKSFGIRVTVVAPGAFRTGFGNRFKEPPPPPQPTNRIPDYEKVIAPALERRKTHMGTQPGDPYLGSCVIIDAVEDPNSPFRLFLGKDAVEKGLCQLESIKKDIESYAEKASATDFKEETSKKSIS